MVTSDFRPEVKIWPFRACSMHLAITIGTVLSLWTWLWGRYHVPQNVFLVRHEVLCNWKYDTTCKISRTQFELQIEHLMRVFVIKCLSKTGRFN